MATQLWRALAYVSNAFRRENAPTQERELYFAPDVARELIDNPELLAFFEALTKVNPCDHGTNFILSPEKTPTHPRLRLLNGTYGTAEPREFPHSPDGSYDIPALVREIDQLVKVDGITEVEHYSAPGRAALRRSALFWDGGVCATLDRMGIPNNRPLPERFYSANTIGTGTLSIITASYHLPGYTVRLHDDGRVHVFKEGLIVGSSKVGEIKASADAYEAAAPVRHAMGYDLERRVDSNVLNFLVPTMRPESPKPASARPAYAFPHVSPPVYAAPQNA